MLRMLELEKVPACFMSKFYFVAGQLIPRQVKELGQRLAHYLRENDMILFPEPQSNGPSFYPITPTSDTVS